MSVGRNLFSCLSLSSRRERLGIAMSLTRPLWTMDVCYCWSSWVSVTSWTLCKSVALCGELDRNGTSPRVSSLESTFPIADCNEFPWGPFQALSPSPASSNNFRESLRTSMFSKSFKLISLFLCFVKGVDQVCDLSVLLSTSGAASSLAVLSPFASFLLKTEFMISMRFCAFGQSKISKFIRALPNRDSALSKWCSEVAWSQFRKPIRSRSGACNFFSSGWSFPCLNRVTCGHASNSSLSNSCLFRDSPSDLKRCACDGNRWKILILSNWSLCNEGCSLLWHGGFFQRRSFRFCLTYLFTRNSNCLITLRLWRSASLFAQKISKNSFSVPHFFASFLGCFSSSCAATVSETSTEC